MAQNSGRSSYIYKGTRDFDSIDGTPVNVAPRPTKEMFRVLDFGQPMTRQNKLNFPVPTNGDRAIGNVLALLAYREKTVRVTSNKNKNAHVLVCTTNAIEKFLLEILT